MQPTVPRPAIAWLAALALPLAATGACLALDGSMSVAGLAMVYLIASLAGAALLPRLQSAVAAVLCVTALNFFFVPPRYSFEVDGAEYWWTLAVLLAVSLLLQTLVSSLRSQQAAAQRAVQRAADLHALSERLSAADGTDAMADAAARWLHARLGLPAAVVLSRAGRTVACVAAGASADRFEMPVAQWTIEHGRPLGRGTDDWRDLPVWAGPFASRDAGGAVMLLLGARMHPGHEEVAHWEALSRQVGLSIERERAATDVRDASDAAQAEAARNMLLASLSHDLRTPLAGILGSASTLRSQGDALTPTQRDRLLANLEDETRDLAAMADNVLQMARLSQPQRGLRLQWESVEEILGTVVARMRRRWPAARIELRGSGELPPVRAEAGLLAQLLANLVDNAVRHGGGAAAHVVLRAGRSRTGVFVAVRDHGAGLPEGDPQLLFERHHRGDGTGGAGLGLALCRLVAQQHGGTLVAQRCDPGAEFRLDLPAATPETVHAA